MKTLRVEEAKMIDDALEKGAREIESLAKAIVPTDTGELRDAIEVRETLEGVKVKRMAFGTTGGRKGRFLVRYVGVFGTGKGSKGYYAPFVEYGTKPGVERTVGRKMGKRGRMIRAYHGPRVATQSAKQSGAGRLQYRTHPGTPARPFLRPAFQSKKARVVNRVKRAINKAAKQVALRGRQNP
jgi:HK97 gp10 family phage protein